MEKGDGAALFIGFFVTVLVAIGQAVLAANRSGGKSNSLPNPYKETDEYGREYIIEWHELDYDYDNNRPIGRTMKLLH